MIQAATSPHISGEITHEAAISHTFHHETILAVKFIIDQKSNTSFSTIYKVALAVIQAQIKPHITECVAETGALKYVAIFIHKAAHNKVAIII